MNRPQCIIFTLFLLFGNALAENGYSKEQSGAGIMYGPTGQGKKIIALVPPAPVLISPPTNSSLGINDTALVWSSVPGADSYRVQISLDGAYFTIVVVDTTINNDTTLLLRRLIGTKLSVGLRYFWHVSASNAGGVSPYSEVWSFIPIFLRQFVPAAYWFDTGGALIEAHGGGFLYDDSSKKYYWYGEDRSASSRYAIGVSCYSSENLYNWKFEGIVLPASATNSGGKTPVLERPKVIYNDSTHKYVMWMHIDYADYSYAEAGVAVADSPTGPFSYLGSERPNYSMSRDMTLFKDDDGKAYLIYSSENNATMHVSLLTGDYLHQSGTYNRVLINDSREAPAVFKYESKYYMISSGTSGWAPNEARYATANSPLGPWILSGDPCTGPDAGTTFGGQSTYVLPVSGKPGEFIFMADKWNPSNLPKSTYIWLPLLIKNGQPVIQWYGSWDLSLFGSILGIKNDVQTRPAMYSLSQNYPNPFNPATEINYSIPKRGIVTLKIYNMLGQQVAELVNREQMPGNYTARFDASKLASGIYLYRIRSGNFSLTKKMVLLK